jgi:pentatricopeptide repeat protein
MTDRILINGLGKASIMDVALACSQDMEKEAYFRWVLSLV